MILEYRSIADMNASILSNLHKFPHDVDLIVGIPRSGMLPANLIALYLNKPYTDIDSYCNGVIYSKGERRSLIDKMRSNKVLVIDDSISGGGSIEKAKKKIADSAMGGADLIYGVVYATSWSVSKIDCFCEIIDEKRIFQWNLFHHPWITSQAFFDIDGVLCPNPPIDDDGEKYIQYISNAPLLYKPSVEIDTLISCRLEKYRKETEMWLELNGIRYKRLIMLDLPSKEERLKWGKHGYYKGEYYKKSNSYFFVESSLHEAKQIAEIAKKPVFCIETFSMINDEQVLMKKNLEIVMENILQHLKQF